MLAQRCRDAETQRRGGMNENQIGDQVLRAAIEVHRELGLGLLETVYEGALLFELRANGLAVESQVPIPIRYKDVAFELGFRADLIVENKVVLELKSVEQLSAAHRKQIQTYLRLTGLRLGYLLNFGAALLKDGIVRAVNNPPE